MKPRGPGGITVTLSEYAWAIEGIGQAPLDCIGKARLAGPARLGGPNAPVNPWPARVSTTRQGVIPTKRRAFAADTSLPAVLPLLTAFGCAPVACFSAWVGCQYSGAGQGLSGTAFSRATCAASNMGRKTRSDATRP